MKRFIEVLLALTLILLICIAIVCLIAKNNGFTVVEQIKQWLGIVAENPPAIDPTKKIGF